MKAKKQRRLVQMENSEMPSAEEKRAVKLALRIVDMINEGLLVRPPIVSISLLDQRSEIECPSCGFLCRLVIAPETPSSTANVSRRSTGLFQRIRHLWAARTAWKRH